MGVKKKNLDNIYEIVKANPGLGFEEILKKLKSSSQTNMVRSTLNNGLNELILKNIIIKKNKKYYFNDRKVSNNKDLKNMEISNPFQPWESEIFDILPRLFSLKKLGEDLEIKNSLNYDPKMGQYLYEYIRGMDNTFENIQFLNMHKEWIKEEKQLKIKEIINYLKYEYLKLDFNDLLDFEIDKSLEVLYFLKELMKEQLKINLSTNQEVVFSNNINQTIFNNIFELLMDKIYLNPEFISTVKNIEDFFLNLNISFDPINTDRDINLKFLSDEFKPERLKYLVDKYSGHLHNKNLIESDLNHRKEILKDVKFYEQKLKTFFKEDKSYNRLKTIDEHKAKKIIVNQFLKFKQLVKGNEIETIFKNILRESVILIKENQNNLIVRKLGFDIFNKSIKKLSNEEISNLKKQGKFSEAINLIAKLEKKESLKEEDYIDLLINKSAILNDGLKDYNLAFEIVKDALDEGYKNPYLYINMSAILVNKNKPKDAINILDKALEDNKLKLTKNLKFKIKFRKSLILFHCLDDMGGALKIISDSLEENSIDTKLLKEFLELEISIYLKRAELSDSLESKKLEYQNILKTLDKLIVKEPNNIDYYERKIRLLEYYLYDFDLALSTINKLIEMNPKNVSYYVNKSRIQCDNLNHNHHLDDALKTITEGLSINNKEINLYINKAVVYSKILKFDDALKILKEAEELEEFNKFNIDISKLKIKIYFKKEDYKKALEESQKALILAPEDIDLILLHIEIIEKAKDINSSIIFLEGILDKFPHNIDLIERFIELCLTYNKVGYLRKAIPLIDNIIEDEDKNPELYAGKAKILYIIRKNNYDYDAIMDILKEGIKIDNQFSDFYNIEALLAFNKGEYKKALTLIDKAINLETDDDIIQDYYHNKSGILDVMNKKISLKDYIWEL